MARAACWSRNLQATLVGSSTERNFQLSLGHENPSLFLGHSRSNNNLNVCNFYKVLNHRAIYLQRLWLLPLGFTRTITITKTIWTTATDIDPNYHNSHDNQTKRGPRQLLTSLELRQLLTTAKKYRKKKKKNQPLEELSDSSSDDERTSSRKRKETETDPVNTLHIYMR